MKKLGIAAASALLALAPAAAQTPVSVPAFDSLELRGGGRVTVRHGAEQSVTLVRGDPAITRFTVDRDGRLRIDACTRTCRDYDLRVEIVIPELDAVAIEGGGTIRADGRFPERRALAIAVSGGGTIDMSAVSTADVAASVHGGGSITTHARNSLAASINGGGSVRYLGDPSVSSAINGGGSVAPASR
jgi:hypothetical protein